MSGSNALPPIQIRVDGADTAARAIDSLTAAAQRMGAQSATAGGQLGSLRTEADAVGGATRNLAAMVGQAGYQVHDFAVQVASGQSALTAFIQQGSQLAGIFGPAGVLAGAALAIGGIAAQFLFMGESAEQAQRRAQTAFAGMREHAEQTRDVIAQINDLFLTANQRASAAENRYVRTLRENALREQDIAVQRQEGAQIELSRAERELAQQEAREAAELNRRIQSLEGRRAAAQGRLAEFLAPYEEESRQRLFGATERVASLRVEITRAGADAGRLAEVLRRLETFGEVDYDMPTPPVPPADEGYGRGPARERSVYGPLDDTGREWRRFEEQRARALERQAREEQRELERREERNARVTDRIVDYAAERFADLFDKNGRGWEGMLQGMERTARSVLARIAAELVLRPIVAPVVSYLGLGNLGGGNGGFAGVGSLVGGGGTVAAGGGGGSLMGSLGQLGSVRSLFGGGGGSGYLSFLSTPVWTSGGGWFGAGAVSAPSIAGMSTEAAMASLPAVPTSATTGIGGLGSLGAASLASWAGGIGGGFMIGSTIGGLVARTPAQRLNSQIGAGVGATAGAAVGTMILPGVGTVIGGLLGGALGGGGGGLLGPSKGFSGGDVMIGVQDGQLVVVGSAGKRWNAAEAESGVRQQLDQINALLRQNQISIVNAPSMGPGWKNAVDVWGFGGSPQGGDARSLFEKLRGSLKSDNATIQQVINSSGVYTFEDLFNFSDWTTRVYEPLSKVKDATKDYAEAIGQQLRVYDEAIAVARRLGLAEEGLLAARARAQAEVLNARNTEVYTREETLRIAELRLSKDPRDLVKAAMMEFSLNSGLGRQELIKYLEDRGIGPDTEVYQDTLARYLRVVNAQRAAARQQAEYEVGLSGRSLMEELTVGGLGGITPSARYAAALRVLQDARRTGDLDRLTAAARNILPVARDYLGTSERYGTLVADISRDVRRLGGDPVGLASFLEGQAAGNDALERIYGLSNSQLAELKAMRAEITRLNGVLETLIARRAA